MKFLLSLIIVTGLICTTAQGPKATAQGPKATATAQGPSTGDGVKPYAYNDLVKVTQPVTGKIIFCLLSPKGLKYDATIVTTESGQVFQFFAAMPKEDIVFLFGEVTDDPLQTPDTLTIPYSDKPAPVPRTELQTKIDEIGLTAGQRETAVAAISQALVSSSGQDLINRTFTNLKPLVQTNTTAWTPFLVWLKTRYEAELGTDATDDKVKQVIQELANAFAS